MLRFFFFALVLCLLPVAGMANSQLDNALVRKALIGRGDDIRLLIKQGADPDARDHFQWTALSVAANRRDEAALEAVQALVEGGASVNKADPGKHYPIINALMNKRTDIVAYLLDSGADYYITNKDGVPLRDLAREYGTPEMSTMIESLIAADVAREAALRSPERLRKLIYDYAYAACAGRYYQFYIDIGQAKFEERNVDDKMEKHYAALDKIAPELQKYFDFTTKSLSDLIKFVGNDITAYLNTFVSHRHMRKNKVGTDQDINKRCSEIAGNWQEQY